MVGGNKVTQGALKYSGLDRTLVGYPSSRLPHVFVLYPSRLAKVTYHKQPEHARTAGGKRGKCSKNANETGTCDFSPEFEL